ncbi:MAG: GAF and ANTAR domain-containing protein [Pseudonocardia sp.]|nr:GAF and ANTAR domain-containing protein [Pseudonocardia sp.]
MTTDGREPVVNAAHTDRERSASRAFVELADTLVDDYDVIDLLDRLIAHSVHLLAAEAAGIMLADNHGTLRMVASSSEAAEFMELLQLQAGEGPCMDCYRTATAVGAPDLARDPRWPGFTAAVLAHGRFRSVHALPLRLRGDAIGALNLFHRIPGPLPADDLALGQALADVATIGILSERAVRRGTVVTEQLQHALDTRIVIEQAKGVLSEQAGVGLDEAFERLRSYARHHNLRLADVARRLLDRTLDASAFAPRPR